MALTHVVGERVFKVRRLALLGHRLHVHGVVLTALAESHGAVAALEAYVALAHVLVGERHPHAQRLAGRHGIGIDVERERDIHVAPVAHVVSVGRGAHRFQIVLAAGEETLVVVGGILCSKLLAQQPQVAHALAEPHLLAVDVHHLQGTGVFPVLDLGIGGLGHLLANHFHALLGGDAEVGADALHDGHQRVDAHSIGLAHLLGQRFHQLIGASKLALCDILVHLGLPVRGYRHTHKCQCAGNQCQQTFLTFHNT